MNKSDSRPPLRPSAALAILAIVLGLMLIVGLTSFFVPLALAAQAYALVIILLAFRYSAPVWRWFARMPRLHRGAFFLLIGAMIIGHFTLNGRTFFPFVAWEIFPFVREDDPVTCQEFRATTASGKSVRLLVEQLFPSIVQFDPPAHDSLAMTHLIQALVKMYDQQHRFDPVRQVDLVELSVRLHPSLIEAQQPPSCQLLRHYDFSLDRLN